MPLRPLWALRCIGRAILLLARLHSGPKALWNTPRPVGGGGGMARQSSARIGSTDVTITSRVYVC